MPSFTLTFSGLIMHYDRANDGKRAVLVDDPSHAPVLVVPTAGATPNGWTGTPSGGFTLFPLKDRHVVIVNSASGAVTGDSKFASKVPSLKNILKNPSDNPHDEIRNGTLINNKIAAYVDYSGANTLTVTECFESEMVFDPAITGDPRCIGKTISFTGTTTTGNKITIKDLKSNGTIEVPDGTEIAIRNTSSGGAAHHKEFKRLMKLNTEPIDMVRTVRTCANCAAVTSNFVELPGRKLEALLELFPELRKAFEFVGPDIRGMFVVAVASVSVECSNTQWP